VNLSDADRAREELGRAIGSGHPETIARVAMSNIWPLYSCHSEMLTAAISTLPSPVLERYPVLRIIHPMTPVLARTTRPFKPLMYQDQARSMSPEEVDLVTVVQMIAFRTSGDVAAALIYARRLEDRILQTRVESRERTDGPLWFFHHQIGSTLLAAGDSSRALQEFATCRQLGRFSNQPDAQRLALGRTALAHAVRGSLDDADRALADARLQPPPTTAHVNSSRTSEATAAALVAVDRMSDDLDDRLAGLDPYDTIELTWPFALLARSRAFLAHQRPEDSLEAIRLARDAHPAQHGSFATDVIAAMSIKALLAIGDIPQARRIADQNVKAGVLTRLATVRVSLNEGRFDAAGSDIRLLTADRDLGPAQRSESVLLSGWLELASTGDIDVDTAGQIARIAKKPESRRLLATMPRQLIDHVKQQLPDESAAEFDAITTGLRNYEMRSRPMLTSGEQRVLNALPSHGTTAEMASAFHVSPNTVKSQLKSLYRKLGCSTREDAIKIASRLHLLVDVE
jgi:ATP/maltotriose-dependent transcriptional regulator MalT